MIIKMDQMFQTNTGASFNQTGASFQQSFNQTGPNYPQKAHY
mgnify:FL=1